MSDTSAAEILASLDTKAVGRNLLYYPEVTSTMDVLRTMAVEGAAPGTTVAADIQTAGRGRLQRTWLSPVGSISLSILVKPYLEQLPGLIMVASLAVVRALDIVGGIKAMIKWPNDVLVNGRKVCGILIENSLAGRKVNWAIVGIGINVNVDPSSISTESAYAASISGQLGRDVSKAELVKHVLEGFEYYYLAMRLGETVYRQWRDRLETLGKEVQVSGGGVIQRGIAESVDADGSLMLRKADGNLVKVVAGDVTLRR